MPSINWGTSSLTYTGSQAVYIRQRWSDPWVYQPNIWCQECSWSLLPAMPTATLLLDYGQILPHGQSAWTTQSKLAIGGWYVKVVHSCADGSVSWCGFIDEIADEQGGINGIYPTGRQTFVAYSVAQALAHEFITRTRWNDPVNSMDRWAGSAGTFNADGKGNMSPAETSIDDDNVFDYGHVSRDLGTFWSSRDIVRYLFSYCMPLDKSGNQKIKFRVDGLELVPNWDKPTIETEGQSVLSILQAIVNPSRMLQMSILVDESTNPNTVVFQIHSLASTSLSLPNGNSFTANGNTLEIVTYGAQDTNVATQGSVTSRVDQIVVRGARRESVATFQITEYGESDQGLKEQFTTAIKDAYDDGASGSASYSGYTDAEKRRANEIARTQKTIEDAYRVFTINDEYSMNPLAGFVFETDDTPGQQYYPWWGGVRFSPQLPFKRGIDYSGTAIPSNTHGDNEKMEDYRPPLVLFKRTAETQYLQCDRMANIDNNPSFSVAVGIDYDGSCFTLDVNGAEQHAIADGRFNALLVDRSTTDLGSWDYRNAKCTFAIQEDRFAEVKYPADDDLSAGLDVIRRKVIYAGAGYRLVRVLADTAVDVDVDGALKTVTSTAYLRDDRDDMRSLAYLAASWFLVSRKIARLISARPTAQAAVGQLLTTINAGTPHADTINTVVSEIRLATPLGEGGFSQPPQFSLTTAMGELDPLAFVPPPPTALGGFQSIPAGPA